MSRSPEFVINVTTETPTSAIPHGQSVGRIIDGIFVDIWHTCPLSRGSLAPSQREVDLYIERLGVTMPTQRTFELVCEIREMVERRCDLQHKVELAEARLKCYAMYCYLCISAFANFLESTSLDLAFSCELVTINES